MNRAEALKAIGEECPRRILPQLHARGLYRHYHLPGCPGPVCCFAREALAGVPEGYRITEAQGYYEAISAPPGERVAGHISEGSGV